MKNKDLRGNGGWRKGIQTNRSLPPTPTLPTLVPPPPRNAGQGVGEALVQVQVRGAFLDLVLPPSDQMAHSVHVAEDRAGGGGDVGAPYGLAGSCPLSTQKMKVIPAHTLHLVS